ncbi:MAG: RNA polymerase sigma factor [Calothrix sp. MO_192.B10]|nr:RNA polymerase sigma factor [Calothrix sp. MO_192.B10]
MHTTTNRIGLLSANTLQTTKNLEEQLLLERFFQGERNTFWLLWQQHRDYLYFRCLSWMGGNYNDAEDVLSLASLKAWEQFPEYVKKITNVRAWFTRLTHNLCVDLHRKRDHRRMTSMEEMSGGEDEALISSFASPESAILDYELKLYIRHAVSNLGERLRHPFVLRYYHKNSYQDIAQRLRLNVDNVYKRIQQARKILQRRLSQYLSGLDDSVLDFADYSGNSANRGMEDSPFDRRMLWESKVATTMESLDETISYQVSATCLEVIPQSWYHSPSLLGWK